MARNWMKAILRRVIDESLTTKRFLFEVPELESFDYKAGQFITFDLPIQSKGTLRSYSIASAPDGTNTFELCIVLNVKGAGTPYIFAQPLGAEFKFMGPLGKFLLHEPIETDLCFIATGTGIAPLRSMIYNIYDRELPHKNIYCVFGNRYVPDILYRNELEKLEKKHPEFKFIPTLSRAGDEWQGPKGYVHQYYENLFSDHREAHFYLCGWSDMINEARKRLEAMGYTKTHVHFEKFD